MTIHSRKAFQLATGHRNNKQRTEMALTFSNIKEWMDSMCLKLSSEKTEYIMFGSHQQLTKINPEPLQAGPDLTELSNKVKYLGTLLDNTLSYIIKVQKAMANFISQVHMQIYHQGSLYHTPPDVMHVTSGLFKCSTVWHTQ